MRNYTGTSFIITAYLNLTLILERLLIIKNKLLTVIRFQRGKGYFCVLHNYLRKIKIPGHYKVITERTRHLIRYASRGELSEAICNKYHVADDKSNRKDIPDGSFRVEEAMAERHYSSKKAAARHKGLRTNLGHDGGTM